MVPPRRYKAYCAVAVFVVVPVYKSVHRNQIFKSLSVSADRDFLFSNMVLAVMVKLFNQALC